MAKTGSISNHQILRALLKPVVRFCLRRGLRLRDVYEALKASFVDCANEQLAEQGFETNTSRISVMTGMQRRDVLRVAADKSQPKSDYDVLRRVIGYWQSNKSFSNSQGPRPLSHVGKDSEFAELVREVSLDINPYTILFELERLGLVDKKTKQVQLKSEALNVSADAARSVQMLSGDLNDLVQAVEGNTFDKRPVPHHHIKTEYDNVALKALPEISSWLLDEGAKFHQKVRRFLSRFDKDINPKLQDDKPGVRVALGSFSFIEDIKEKKERTR